MKKEKKKSKAMPAVIFVTGSIALFAAACVVISKYLPYVSGAINKNMVKRSNAKVDEDDWGPVIERKVQKSEEEKQDAD